MTISYRVKPLAFVRVAITVVFSCLVLGLFHEPLYAQINSTWNGGTGNWSGSTNWNPAGVPNNTGTISYNVTIGGSHSIVTMDVLNDTVNTLALGTTDSLKINASDGLRLTSGPSSNSGKLTNFGGLDLGFVITSSTLTNNSGASLTNYGNLGWGSGSGVINSAGASLVNVGTIDFGSFAGSPTAQLVNNGTFINSSLLDASGYSNIVNSTGAYFANSGTVGISTSDFSNSGKFNNSGAFTFFAASDPASFFNSGTFNNSGTMSVGYSPFTNNSFSNSGTINNSGTMSVQYVNFDVGADSYSNAGKINNSGTMTISATTVGGESPNLAFSNKGTINNSGTLNNTSGSILANGGTIKNTGTINNSTGASLSNSGTLNNTGTILNDSTSTFTNSGTLNNRGTINNSGAFTNSGDVNISKSGLFTTSTDYTQTAGSTRVNGTLTSTGNAIVDIKGGTLGGGGTINGNVLMGGTIIAGTTGHPLMLDINGNYKQTGVGVYDELISSTTNGLLNISGSATLDPGASLDIALLGGFDPSNGTSFTIMDYGSESGAFVISDPLFNGGTQQWVITSYKGGDGDDIVLTAEAAAADPVATPEPGTMLLLGMGLLGVSGYAMKKGGAGAR